MSMIRSDLFETRIDLSCGCEIKGRSVSAPIAFCKPGARNIQSEWVIGCLGPLTGRWLGHVGRPTLGRQYSKLKSCSRMVWDMTVNWLIVFRLDPLVHLLLKYT
jgi:hypothetical protein